MAVKSVAVAADVSIRLAPGSTPHAGFDPGGTWAEVALAGSSTALRVAGQALLRDGDSAQDGYGNAITVAAAGPLRSD